MFKSRIVFRYGIYNHNSFYRFESKEKIKATGPRHNVIGKLLFFTASQQVEVSKYKVALIKAIVNVCGAPLNQFKKFFCAYPVCNSLCYQIQK